MAVIKSAASTQLATAQDTGTGKDSPLSCIHTLVANAGAVTQWPAIDDKIPLDSCDSGQSESDENNLVIHLNVDADDRTSADADLKQASCVIRKRPSATEDTQNKVAKHS